MITWLTVLSLGLNLFVPVAVAESEPRKDGAPAEEQASAPAIRTEIEVRAEAPLVEENLLTVDLVSASRVSKAQMEDLQAVDLLTGLRMTPGVLISRYNVVGSYGGGDGGTLFIRGMGSGRPGGEVQFLVDGVPKFSGVWTHPLMDVLSLDSVEHVDVVKGASPVLYGNMSFGAVEIRTRRREREGSEGAISTGGGSFGTLLTHLDGGFRRGAFDAYVTAGYRSSDGHRPQSDGRVEDFFGRAGYTLSPGWRLDFTLSRTDSYADDPGPAGAPPPPRGKFAIRDWTVTATLENDTPRARGYFRFYRDQGAIRWEQWNAAKNLPLDSDTDYANWGFRARQTFPLLRGLKVTAGFDGDNYGGSFRETLGTTVKVKDEVRMWNAAPYLLAEAEWGNRVKFGPVAGVRYDVSRYFGTFAAPQAGFALSFGRTRLHASAGRGFNLPGVYAVFSTAEWNQGDRWMSLRPEKVLHLEGGVSHAFNDRLRLDLTLFRDRGTDALRFTAPPPHYDNIGSYRTRGVEVAVGADPLDSLHAFAGYTFLDAEPERLPYAPRHTAQFGVNWDASRRLRLSLDAQYVGGRWSGNPRYPGPQAYMEGFFLLNARVRWTVSPRTWTQALVVYAGVENVTDARYEYRPGYEMPGATFQCGLRLALDGGR
ncbi:MAG: TonB-dependent receptor plug domain-containing protein [Acidobacteria bacterium]|nr:TonB-dependent receptor plug domain-containing protein [Acidobacteriota bacterium]